MPTTKKKPGADAPEEITEEARGYLEEAANLERARPNLADRVTLGEASGLELRRLDDRIGDLRSRAESVMTPQKLQATQEENARAIKAQQEASERIRLGNLTAESILRYRHEEYSRLGIVPDSSTMGRVEIPKATILQVANRAEEMLGGSGVCAEDMHRQQALLNVYGAHPLLSMSYDDAAQEYLGRSAREVRDEALDRFLGIRLQEETGAIVDAALTDEEIEKAEAGEDPPLPYVSQEEEPNDVA